METPLAKQEVEFGISWVFLGLVGGHCWYYKVIGKVISDRWLLYQ